jgi:hypothetical protein
MAHALTLKNPYLVAVWPGMGHVALSAGYYLMAKLGMHALAEFSAHEMFDVEHVEVKRGLIRTGRLPRSRIFAWTDPNQVHDLAVFIGEAQPPIGKLSFCQRLVKYARQLGVERVFTFAAMATNMHPDRPCRVFGAATDEETLQELERLKLEILEDGHIGGLNGVLLGVAAEQGLHGACLLGEMPHIFAQLPFPKASLAVLDVFSQLAGIELDLAELAEQAENVERQLGELLAKVERGMQEQPGDYDEQFKPEAADEGKLTAQDEQRIETLFAAAQRDRSQAYELKRELDRLNIFSEYEDRFLDLFKKVE